MKKIAALLMCILLLTGTASADTDYSAMETEDLYQVYDAVLAELLQRNMPAANTGAHTDVKILYRGIPWGASPAVFSEEMNAIGVTAGFREYSMPSVETHIYSDELESIYTIRNTSGYFSNPYAGELVVGGIPVSYIGAYFHYGFDEDEVYEDQTHAKLYRAYYYFAPVDFPAAYEMLRGKLEQLYGEAPDYEVVSGSSWAYTNHWTIWEDAEGSSLCLYYHRQQRSSGSIYEELYLYYGVGNSIELLTDLEAAMAREEMEKGMDDMSGL